jgi:integral membrane sensor domain MASE1
MSEAIHTRPRGFPAKYLGTMAAVTLVYFGAAKVGLSFAFATKQVTAFWPPTGIAVAALLLFGYRLWPAAFLGAFFLNATSNEPFVTAAGIAVGNTLGPVATVFLLRRFVRFDNAIATVRDALGLCLCGALGMTVTASNGVAHLAFDGIIPWSAYGSVWWVWWIGDTMGVLVVSPLILAWAGKLRLHEARQQAGELALLLSIVVFLGLVVLNGTLIHLPPSFQHQYALFPLLIWVALRFSQRAAATVVALIVGLAVWGAIHERGPFATGNLDERLILLELFMAAVVMTGLALAAVTTERRVAQGALNDERDKLEHRVTERTRDLATANA